MPHPLGPVVNPYQRILPDGTIKNDTVFTEQMMDYCRAQLGPRCVLENHSIREVQNQGPSYDRLYSFLDARGGPIAFQTAAPERVGDLDTTLRWAVQHGAPNVGLPVSYRTTASPASMLTINQDLIANAQAATLLPAGWPRACGWHAVAATASRPLPRGLRAFAAWVALRLLGCPHRPQTRSGSHHSRGKAPPTRQRPST